MTDAAGKLSEWMYETAELYVPAAQAQARERELLEANNRYLDYARIAQRAAAGGFQARVDPWLLTCFGETIARDRQERSHRFLEEALELVQAAGCTASEAHQLVDYVFARPVGEMDQEIGGVMVTLAALCLAHGHDMAEAGERELARVWTKIEKIRAKQAAKPKHSPLPEHVPGQSEPAGDDRIDLSALNDWFQDGVPPVAMKIMFPERSHPLTTAEVRHVLAALASAADFTVPAEGRKPDRASSASADAPSGGQPPEGG